MSMGSSSEPDLILEMLDQLGFCKGIENYCASIFQAARQRKRRQRARSPAVGCARCSSMSRMWLSRRSARVQGDRSRKENLSITDSGFRRRWITVRSSSRSTKRLPGKAFLFRQRLQTTKKRIRDRWLNPRFGQSCGQKSSKGKTKSKPKAKPAAPTAVKSGGAPKPTSRLLPPRVRPNRVQQNPRQSAPSLPPSLRPPQNPMPLTAVVELKHEQQYPFDSTVSIPSWRVCVTTRKA